MARHEAPDAHSVARRYAALAAASVLCTLGLATIPGVAGATTTSPAPIPGATDNVLAQSPSPSSTAPDPTATSATPAPTGSPSASSAPTATALPAPTTAKTLAPLPSSTSIARIVQPQGTVSLMGTFTSPHGPYGTMNTDSCAVCHRAHTAQSNALLKTTSPQSTLCFTCHDGTGANTNVQADFTTASTTNVASTTTLPSGATSTTGTLSSYYRHDATVATAHTLGVSDEFGGVLNRHTECSDCHDPHEAKGVNVTVPPANTAWPISGRLAGVSGVSVVNGGTAQAPTQTYTLLDGATTSITYEYQLCFKCHSGWTTQKSNSGVSPMAWALDAGLEFNTVNNSFHPVEGQGKNQSAKMTLSLGAAYNANNPYKIAAWTFTTTDTVRCTQCHSGSMDFSVSSPESMKLNTHVSQNRGLLLQNYRDRWLKPRSQAYSDADFALCYMCHTNDPFRPGGSSTATTNFSRHQLHVSGLATAAGGSASTNIDLAGAGQGNALCSECHYRTHSTATGSKYDHLINFAPNVTQVGTTPMWVANGTGGTCTLTCHGFTHNGEGY